MTDAKSINERRIMRLTIIQTLSILLCMAPSAIGLSGCAEKELAEPEISEGTGCLSVEIALPKTKADAAAEYNALNYSTVRIYSIVRDTENRITAENLVRKYRPASKMPANLYLAAGEYKITVEAGTGDEATFTNKTYYGEETFILEAKRNKSVKVTCKITNVVVKVVFDGTVKTAFDKGYNVLVSAADEFSKEDAEAGNVPALEFSEDGTGYFILPEGVSNLSWGFCGSSSDEAVNAKGEKTGVIEDPQPGMQYTLTYKYSPDADGYLLTMSVQVVDYDELCEDQFVFSPQPVITAEGFSFGETVPFYDGQLKVNIGTVNPLSEITVTVGEQVFTAMAGGVASGTNADMGMELTVTDGLNASLSLLPEFLSNVPGGTNPFVFKVKDSMNAEASAQVNVVSSGATGIVPVDFWYGQAKLTADVLDPAVSDVRIRYREASADEWSEGVMTKSEGNAYVFDATGFTAGRTYDLQLMADGAECGKQIAVQTEAGVQMPNAGFEEWGTFDGIVSPYSSVETAFWGTGNKGADMAKVILTESSTDIRPGSSGKLSARLESKDAKVLGIGKFAAGNLFVGEFGETDMGSMSGTVKMGRAFEFNAKPQSLNGWFKYTQAGSDKGRIFVCLVNMTNGSTYHTVDTNEDNINGDRINVTALDPMAEFIYADIDNPETLEGHIIGYGDLVLETTVPDWTEFEIPIIYREKYAGEKPNVLIVTASASWRGDYFDGAVGSTMYLDDIEFVY